MITRIQTPTTVVVRLDSDGDVLLAGPAVRAVARGSGRVVLVVSPAGRQAAELLPGVDEVLVYDSPWTGYDPPAVDRAAFDAAVAAVAAVGAERGVVLTSFHQSALPAALMLRLAGVAHVTATSEDYPGSLLAVRHRLDGAGDPAVTGMHEVERALATVVAAGFDVDGDPYGDALAVALPAGLAGRAASGTRPRLPEPGYIVVHPGASVPARAASPRVARSWTDALLAAGHAVVVTGAPGERDLTAFVARGDGGGRAADRAFDRAVDLGGRTTFAELAAVLAGASAVVVGNTGPAHLAAAVRTPVVSAFSPVVPWSAWRPWGVPVVCLTARPDSPCTGSRARVCPVEGHPCLDSITPENVVSAVRELVRPVAA